MTDRMINQRVIRGLECCLSASLDEPICPTCTYRYDENGVETGDCEINLLKDAIALLKEQEKEISKWRERWQRQKDTIIGLLGQKPQPRLMTIGDLYGYDMGFYESRDEELVLPVLISRGGPDDDKTVGLIRKDGYELRKDCGLMNITWRIWTACPSAEQREETPWD